MTDHTNTDTTLAPFQLASRSFVQSPGTRLRFGAKGAKGPYDVAVLTKAPYERT